jgi:hypothetical protein
LIENHLEDANTVVPLPNPKFDPKQYAPETIGIGRRKTFVKRSIGGGANVTARPRAETLFNRRDTNNDGLLTLAEYIGNPKGRNVPALTKQFERRDANKDSRLSLQELNAGMKE